MKRGFNLKFSKRNKEAKAKTEMQFVYNILLSFFAKKFLKISSRKEIKMQRQKVEYNFASFSPCHSLREKFSKISPRKEIKMQSRKK